MSEKFKCPYCPKDYKMKHLLVNHIRQSSGDHGEKYSFPTDYKEKMEKVEQNQEKKEHHEISDVTTTDKVKVEQNQEKIENVTKVDPPEIPVTQTNKCPDCGEDKSNWITTSQAHEYDIELNEKERSEYDFVCPKCYELIKVN